MPGIRGGGISPSFDSAVFALIGFSAVVWQIKEARVRNTQQELHAQLLEARKVYMSYSEASLTYAQFTKPNYDALMRNHVEYLRYQNFFSHMSMPMMKSSASCVPWAICVPSGSGD